MLFSKEDLDLVNEQIDIECRKTANHLLFALETDRRCYCRVQCVNRILQVECLTWFQNSVTKEDHGWRLPLNIKDAETLSDITRKVAELIVYYTEDKFMIGVVALGIYQLKISSAGMETIHENIIDRAQVWKQRFSQNVDVNDWCTNRIFVNGRPPKIVIRLNGIIVEKPVVIFDQEDYDDLQTKEEIYGMALYIAEWGEGKYRLTLSEDEHGLFVEMDYFEPKKRKVW